jgi:hypothetical protein
VVVVAHRLSTIQRATASPCSSTDARRARHARELLAENGVYARLWTLQKLDSDRRRRDRSQDRMSEEPAGGSSRCSTPRCS